MPIHACPSNVSVRFAGTSRRQRPTAPPNAQAGHAILRHFHGRGKATAVRKNRSEVLLVAVIVWYSVTWRRARKFMASGDFWAKLPQSGKAI